MSVWEYKVISSGKGGFATPVLLESFLNQLGKEQWEIIEYASVPENPLAFSGLARRPTQRDWTLEDAVSAAAKVEADKLRAEFEAKFKGVQTHAAEDQQPAAAADPAPDDGYRKIRDTDSDQDPDAPDAPEEEWDKLSVEEELPSFFEAMRPHMRRNQRGPGTSVGVDFLAKKWDLTDADIIGALTECGFDVPEDEDAKPVYVEYDGDLYWVNINRRGELWINTKEKPRQVFKIVPGTRLAPTEEAPKPESAAPAPSEQAAPAHREPQERRPEQPSETLPDPAALLQRIRPMMRRNRRGPGGSGSLSFLSRGLRCREADLAAAFATLGLVAQQTQGEKPAFVEIGEKVWWLNKDHRGGVWINERDKKDFDDREGSDQPVGEAPAPADGAAPAVPEASSVPAAEPSPEAAPAPGAAPSGGEGTPVLSAVRLLLKPTRSGGVAALLESLAKDLSRTPEDLLATLVANGLKVPEKPKEKPVFVEHAGEIFWLNLSARDELWLNAKASKFSDSDRGDKKPRRPKSRKKEDEPASEAAAEAPASGATEPGPPSDSAGQPA